MSVSLLLNHFEALGRIPVDVQVVFEEVQKRLIDERIKVHAVDTDVRRLRGIHYRYKIPAKSADPSNSWMMDERIVAIIYSVNQPEEMQRLVFAKELIHAYDREPIRTRGRDEVVRLGQKLAVGDPYTRLSNGNIQSFFDELAKWQALAVLFPFPLRQELIPMRAAGKIDLNGIQQLVQLPISYVKTVMDDEWQLMRESILVGT